MLNFAYAMFMAEAENQFPDKRAKAIDAVVRECVEYYNNGGCVDDAIDDILAKHNLSQDTLSDSEVSYIGDEFIARII